MIAVSADNILREARACLSGFHCEVYWKERGIADGRAAALVHCEPVNLGYFNVGAFLASALENLIASSKDGFCTDVKSVCT